MVNITSQNSKKPITNAADVAGLKLRVMENDVYTATFKALDVNAVPMAWSDALTALQQGTIDGEENPINVIYSYKLWESQKYVTLDRHSYSTAIITMSNDLFKSLPEDVQKIFEESAQEAAEYERQWVADQEADQLFSVEPGSICILSCQFSIFLDPVFWNVFVDVHILAKIGQTFSTHITDFQ